MFTYECNRRVMNPTLHIAMHCELWTVGIVALLLAGCTRHGVIGDPHTEASSCVDRKPEVNHTPAKRTCSRTELLAIMNTLGEALHTHILSSHDKYGVILKRGEHSLRMAVTHVGHREEHHGAGTHPARSVTWLDVSQPSENRSGYRDMGVIGSGNAQGDDTHGTLAISECEAVASVYLQLCCTLGDTLVGYPYWATDAVIDRNTIELAFLARHHCESGIYGDSACMVKIDRKTMQTIIEHTPTRVP